MAWDRCAADLKAYTGVMSLSASEFYEAALALPPSVRKDIALRLLESVEVVGDDAIEEVWTNELASRVDGIRSGKVTTIPGERVFADIAARRAAHNA
jgi:putative addiction module component (TIGR02574 family)